MALTVVSKPSGFRPVAGGSLLYVLTEASLVGKPNYRVEFDFNGLGLPKFEFRPDASLTITADIAPILASVLKLSNLTTDRLKNTYVKYQAVWTGGSDAQVLLSSDVIYFYVGNNHYLNNRTKFHTQSSDGNATPTLSTGVSLLPTSALGDKIKIWLNRNFQFEFLHNNSLPANITVIFNSGSATVSVALTSGNTFAMESVLIDWTTLSNAYNNANNPHIKVVDTATGNTCYLYVPVYILEEVVNPVFIRWINDLGGLAYWLFDYNQDISLSPDGDYKYQVKTLYEKGCTYNEWLALNEMNREGLIYNDSKRIGQFLQDVTTSTIFDCVVIKENPRTMSKKVLHQFITSLRYTPIPNSSVTG